MFSVCRSVSSSRPTIETLRRDIFSSFSIPAPPPSPPFKIGFQAYLGTSQKISHLLSYASPRHFSFLPLVLVLPYSFLQANSCSAYGNRVRSLQTTSPDCFRHLSTTPVNGDCAVCKRFVAIRSASPTVPEKWQRMFIGLCSCRIHGAVVSVPEACAILVCVCLPCPSTDALSLKSSGKYVHSS